MCTSVTRLLDLVYSNTTSSVAVARVGRSNDTSGPGGPAGAGGYRRAGDILVEQRGSHARRRPLESAYVAPRGAAAVLDMLHLL